MDCTQWWGSHFYGLWVMPLVFMILMMVFVAFMIRRMGNGRWADGPAGRRSGMPGQILDRRYASGEISKEQYEQIKGDIEAGQPQS